ncbi:MAG: Lrp/AsnC family transcriptional regulator [Oscillospiraceae bacterium]|nr:Lrp/AsnC family transcriptional regulator [Oscillospiraceae bacterium]
MDQIDQKLIALLQKNARMPLKAITSQVFLSAPAVSARIEKLEAQGLILGYHAEIDQQKLGYPITAFISLALPAQQKASFYPFISDCPNVLECNCITGAYSMLIKVAFASTQELDSFIGELSSFGNTSTQIVFSTPVPPRSAVAPNAG